MIVVWSHYPGNLPSKLMVASDSAITLANIICSKDYQWFTTITTILITCVTVLVIINIITNSMVNCSSISLPSFKWLMEEEARGQVADMRRLWVFLVRHRFQQLWIIVLKTWWQTFTEMFAVLAFNNCESSSWKCGGKLSLKSLLFSLLPLVGPQLSTFFLCFTLNY